MGLLVVVLGILGVLEPCLAQLQPLQSQPEGTSRVPELPPQYSQHDDDPPPPFCISTLLPTTTKEARAGSQSPNRTLILGLAAVALVTLSAATLSSTLRKDNCQAHTTHQLGEQAGFSRSDTSFPGVTIMRWRTNMDNWMYTNAIQVAVPLFTWLSASMTLLDREVWGRQRIKAKFQPNTNQEEPGCWPALLAHAKTHGRGKAALAEAVQALALQKSIRTPEELASLQAQVTAAQQRLKNSAVDKQSSSRRLRSHSAASPSMPLATLPNHTRDKASSPSIERTQQPRGRGGSYLSKRRRSGGVGGPARPSASPRATAPQSGNDTTKAQGGDEHLPSHTREWRRRYMRAYRRRLGSSHEQLFTTVRTAELQQTTYRAVLAALRRDLAILQQVQSNAEHQ
ncbi:uncharacterized protein MONBRDRAFT_26004 [Monosiga brevicollis MX1]|uniref:Uncharacterized protein n=1 Tax=Monosiga brevicollis TaxID=81824 RepID=A9V134_MONBE|nr:uncharacterized protein MONBRDRAFT_26004 [Monosiga brevicollis MX1]EDQ88863.1 predicted protein [Monosiga brevicollis MX1]|eukprot:XP_001746476.1 hypothetical protein [Monosiga brevicollis MX1]